MTMAITSTPMRAPMPAKTLVVVTGFLGPGEQCDDRNIQAGDGCDNQCQFESDGIDCADIHTRLPNLPSDIYRIDPDGDGANVFEAFCNMTTDGGGWTLVIVASDDGQNTWTWNNRRYWDTDTTTFGTLNSLGRDYKSRGHHEVLMNDVLFMHAPSEQWARYNVVNEGAASFAAVIDGYDDSMMWNTNSGLKMTAGSIAANGRLCDTDLYFNVADQDNANRQDAHGPTWNVNHTQQCAGSPFNDPGFRGSLGPGSGDYLFNGVPNTDVEHDAIGFGQSLGLNTGEVGRGQNYMRIYVRRAICGNGVVEGTEACDDGNDDNTDDCANTCDGRGSSQPEWVQVASLPPAFQQTHHSFAFSFGNYGYIVTGSSSTGVRDDFYRYDPSTNAWTELAPFPGSERGFAIGDTWDGKAYFGFGSNNTSFLNDLWVFDPADI